jgi:hypothetical protein
MAYNGWKNRETRNVALWIGNHESLYRSAVAFMRAYKGRRPYADFMESSGLEFSKTPDGISFQDKSLSYSELNSMMREFR